MSITRVDISSEIQDWRDAVYGEEVRSANISALTKLQTQMNAACDGIESLESDATDTLAQAQSASTTANAASASAQTAITTANNAITQAQGYANAAAASATQAAGKVTDAAAYARDANTYKTDALAAKTAAETARDEAREAVPEDYEELTKCVSNPNLLDNGWFTVNQRGASSYTVDGYSIDRWRIYKNVLTVNSGYISVAPTDSTGCIFQIFEDVSAFEGKKLTASIMLNDGTVYSGTITRTNGTSQTFFSNSSINFVLNQNNRFGIYGAMNIRAVKLEYGSISTLANDHAPDYATELLKCQRYYWKGELWSDAYALSASNSSTFFTLPTEMRIKPTITTISLGTLNGVGASKTMTSITVMNKASHRVYLQIASSGLTANQTYVARGAMLELSADL